MNYIKYIISSVLLLSIIGCSSESPDSFLGTHNKTSQETEQQRTQYLAYQHRISVELSKSDIESTFKKITSFCADDSENKCTMLHSSLNTGDHPSSNIKVRIMPTGVASLFSLISQQGKISNKSTDAEDLQDVIVNGNKRLEMLREYQSSLMELEKKSNSIESLIKVAEQLSQVQSDIEYAEGKKAKLLQRTRMDIVDISLRPHSYTSFWGPITDSLADFGENLSAGISQAITAVAYLLPWVIIIVILLYVLRIIWQKTRSRKKA